MNAQQQRYRTVADLMQTDVVTIGPDATVAELAALLRREGISAVPVVDGGGRPIGIASASDLLWICESLLDPFPTRPRPQTVRDVMTPDVFSVSPTDTLQALCRFFNRTGVHRATVLVAGRLVGIVTLTDLLALIAGVASTES